MAKFVCVLGALLLLAANVSMSEAQTVKTYFKAGGDLQLSPVLVPETITSIVWKYEKNLLAEWVKDAINLTYYNRFNGRTNLDIGTGELVIQKMIAADTGVYSVEINNKVQSQVYQAVMIEEVPQPKVYVQPLACNLPQTCDLKCDGDVTEAQPVEYLWKKDNGEWEQSGDKKELSKEEMMNVTTFYCRMKNPVSQKDSKAFPSPFYEAPQPPETSSPGPIAGIIIGVLAAVAAVVVGIWKKDQIREKFSFLCSGATSGSTAKVETQEGKELMKTNAEPTPPGKSPTPNSDDNELDVVTPVDPTPKPSTNGDKGEGGNES